MSQLISLGVGIAVTKGRYSPIGSSYANGQYFFDDLHVDAYAVDDAHSFLYLILDV
jgi:hypothetical protein